MITRLASDRVNSQLEQRPKTNNPPQIPTTNKENARESNGRVSRACTGGRGDALVTTNTMCTLHYGGLPTNRTNKYEFNKEQTKSQHSLHDE